MEEDEEIKDNLLKIEMDIFLNVREEILEEIGFKSWPGTSLENSTADYKIAMCLKNSFRNYESKKSKVEPSYFKF